MKAEMYVIYLGYYTSLWSQLT